MSTNGLKKKKKPTVVFVIDAKVLSMSKEEEATGVV
jgi:hypothetical protein